MLISSSERVAHLRLIRDLSPNVHSSQEAELLWPASLHQGMIEAFFP